MAKVIDQLIINSPYEEPKEHWVYDSQSQSFDRVPGRRRAGYHVATPGTNQFNDAGTFIELELANEIRRRVKAWRANEYPGITSVTRKLLEHWYTNDVRNYPFFFCQLDAIETIIWLAEASASEKTGIEIPSDGSEFSRLCTKLCTGGGKTTVMAMLIAWQVCNKVSYPQDTRFSKNVFIVAPGITVRDRLQVLIPAGGSNYYIEFEVVPSSLLDKLHQGSVRIENWQSLAWDDVESLKKKKSVDKRGPKSDEAYTRQVLGSMAKSRNILVINDEAHHAWRKNPEIKGKYVGVDKKEEQEATIWISGLDRIHKARNILTCYDFSATPFAPSGKKNDEESLFSWIVSDFGLNDGIESGLVKTPRIVVKDDNIPDAKTFRSKLYHIYMDDEVRVNINQAVKPEVPLPSLVIQAYNLLAADWLEKYDEWKTDNSEVPPVMITVANRTETAARIEHAFRHKHIHVDEICDPEFMRHIDSKTLEQKENFVLRNEVNTVGQVGELGEQIRNVISVGMLTEGWDAKTVTHIMGLRAFSSQLLCEQVVGRGLRRSSYQIGENGLYEPEYVNIFGIPFSFLPHEGDGAGGGGKTKTKHYISVVPSKAQYEISWPNITRIDHEIAPHLHVDFNSLPSLTLDAGDIRTRAELAKVLEGKPDLTKLEPIDIEEIHKKLRMQNLIFKTSAMVFKLAEDDWKNEGTPHILLSQIFRLVERYLESNKIIIEPSLIASADTELRKIMYMLHMNTIVSHLWHSIKCQSITSLKPHFNTSNKIRSTGDMATWWTLKHRETFTKTHTNHIVYDSAIEAAEANKLEKNPHVTAFAKNDHLGFAIQ